MPVDLRLAARMAKACDVAYYADGLGGATACPFYADVGFVAPPQAFVANIINAAIVGTTGTEIVVAFRGTLRINTSDWNAFVDSVMDWVNDGKAQLVNAHYTTGLVHRGFDESLESLWGSLLPAIQAQRAATGLPVVVTGHSKGGAMASLAALRLLSETGTAPAAVYTFGSARAGNTPFSKEYNEKIPGDWRFENMDDLVPHLPPTVTLLKFLSQADARFANLSAHGYNHVGTLEFLSWDGGLVEGSTFILDTRRLAHLAELTITGHVAEVATDHSLEKQYIPKLVLHAV